MINNVLRDVDDRANFLHQFYARASFIKHTRIQKKKKQKFDVECKFTILFLIVHKILFFLKKKKQINKYYFIYLYNHHFSYTWQINILVENSLFSLYKYYFDKSTIFFDSKCNKIIFILESNQESILIYKFKIFNIFNNQKSSHIAHLAYH